MITIPATRDPAAYQSWEADDQPMTAPSTRAPGAPKRICIFVEPSPFTYVSGYKNRFTSMIKYLVEAGCEVLVVTTGARSGQCLHSFERALGELHAPARIAAQRSMAARCIATYFRQ